MRFFSRYKILIILLGFALGSLFFAIAAQLIGGSLPRDLLVNLSAGSITISLAVILVDFLLSTEHKLSNKDAIALAAEELHHAGLLLILPIGKLYKVEFSGVQELDKAAAFILSGLDKIDMKKSAQQKGDFTNDFLLALKSASVPLNEVQQQYSYALPNALLGTVVKLRKNCLLLHHLISQTHQSTADGGSDTLGRHFYLGLFEDIKKLITSTQKL